MSKPEIICDTEAYPNFWSIGFLRPSDGRELVFEHSVRKPITQAERDRIAAIMLQNTIVGYNFQNYDAPMIAHMLGGADNAALKSLNDRIIVGGWKWWQLRDSIGINVPRSWDIVDLIEPQPNAFASLKTLAGRMHAPKMQDLPFDPDVPLTHEQMDIVLSYMGNDNSNTRMLREFLDEPLELRRAIGGEYGLNVMSKSDAQVGEAIIKRRVEQATGQRIEFGGAADETFRYKMPPWLAFERDDLRAILDRLRTTEFVVQANGKVELPPWLAKAKVTIGDTTYQMGIGGLHSTESNRALHSDDTRVLIDADVASYYPAIIINSGLYPKALGRHFLVEYEKIRAERVAAKRRAGEIEKVEIPALRQEKADGEEAKRRIKKRYTDLVSEQERNKVKAEGLKIALNGCFGKLGSPYSVLYAPHLMIAVTLTGQLALLMLIERAERAGIPVVSGNTDGVVFHCPRSRENQLSAIMKQWEADTGFELEQTRYRALYNASVNSYIAIKEDGKAKWKGPIANPWRSDDGWTPDLRGQLMKNPQMPILANAVVDHLLYGRPLEQTIRASRDVRDFVTVVKVTGGATWRGEYLGKVVRYIWAKGGEEILRAMPHPSTGNFGKVSKSDGCRPLMDLPSDFPEDIDYERYVAEAREILMDLGAVYRPPPVKPIRIYKRTAWAWFALVA